MATSSAVTNRVKSLFSSFISDLSSNDDKGTRNITIDDNQTSISTKEASKTKCTSTSRNRAQYYDRVETYSALTWFAKPYDLSPLVCARYGWVNTETDMLQCVNCKAFLSGQLPKAIDQQVYKESCEKLKKGLKDNHEKLCVWSTNPCPESFSKVPYHNREELIDNFRHRFESLQGTVSKLPCVTYTSLLEQQLTVDTIHTLAEEILKHTMLSHVETRETELTLFSVCGWSYSEGQVDVLRCSCCRRKVGLWNYNFTSGNKDKKEISIPSDSTQAGKGDDNQDEEPTRKRTKIEKQSFDPVAEHRYWCPWIQPSSLPLVSRQAISTSPQSSPHKNLSPRISPSTTPLQSPRANTTTTEDTVPAWLLVMRLLSHSIQGDEKDFCSQMKQSPQVEGLRHLRKVLRDCTSPTSTT